MSAKEDFEKQIQDYATNLRTEIEAGMNAARWNVNSPWGGTDEDKAHWSRVFQERKGTLAQLNKNLEPLLNAVKNDIIDPIQIGLAKSYLAGDAMAMQAVDELGASKKQLGEQNEQLSQFRKKVETQYFGAPDLSLSAALANPQGDIGNLNTFLTKQQSDIFRQELAPVINMQLGAQGIRDSGANVELQAKALGQLERQRQSSLMEAALGGRAQVHGLQREDILGDIGAKQAQLSNVFDLQRQSITMSFQRQLEQERANLARELSQHRGGSSMLSQVLGGVGLAGSIIAAPFTGGLSLLAAPGFIGSALGEGGMGGINAGTGALGGAFLSRAGGQGGKSQPKTGVVRGGRMTDFRRYPSGLYDGG